MRALTLSVGLSLMSVGLLGSLASEFATQRYAITLPEALRAPQGSRVLVRGLLEGVRDVAGGAALSSISDCAGTRATVFFERGAPGNVSFRLVLLDAKVEEYKGALELVVESAARVEPLDEAAAVLSPDELLEDWPAHLCRTVGFTGTVAWGRLVPGDPRTAEVGVRANGLDLRVLLHSEAYLELTVEPGASATFIGVVAAAAERLEPAVHVKI